MLQAESEKLRQAWIQAVQASIASAYRECPDTCYIEVRQVILSPMARVLQLCFHQDSYFCNQWGPSPCNFKPLPLGLHSFIHVLQNIQSLV